LDQRLKVVKEFVNEGVKVQKVLRYSTVASSTWYNHLGKSITDKRKNNKGRPILRIYNES